jgi:putative PIN family toxin of toxin-antitoxin system
LKVVFDTNIFISALVVPGSRADKALRKIIRAEDALLVSKEILDELLSVLSLKFSRDAEAISRTALLVSDISEIVRPRKRLNVLRDDADNRVLECAHSGRADAIVTGDKEMLGLKEYEGIRILTLKEYLEIP